MFFNANLNAFIWLDIDSPGTRKRKRLKKLSFAKTSVDHPCVIEDTPINHPVIGNYFLYFFQK